MTASAFDSVMRDVAAGISRRTSLLTLGGAALAATVAKPDVSEAKKKKSGDKCKKKEKQRCSMDAAACKTTVLLQEVCDPGGDPATCLAFQNSCDECSANGFLTCFILAVTP